jgi:hypothetical protein
MCARLSGLKTYMAKKKIAAPSVKEKDTGKKGDRAKFWHDELNAAHKRENTWAKRADKVVARYRDEREREENGERRTNILWSNTEILKAVLFQTVGSPDVRRRFPKKGKDEKSARTSALVLERGLSYCGDEYDVDSQVECAVEDHLLAGRGQVWIVYDAVVDEKPSPDDEDVSEAVGISDQSVRIEHVYWKDYRTSSGRKENDIWWKARRHQYSKSELKKYFPEHADEIPLDAEMPEFSRDKEMDESFKRASVWEIWDKNKKERLYIADGYPTILKREDDPYALKEFFPCPPALYGVKTTSSLVPIPEYTLYQDQCEELDAITTRLNRLIDALKRRGVYDASMEGPDNQLSQLAYAGDNEFLPYKGMAVLMEKGGLSGVFQTEDLTPIINVVQQLYQQRSMLIQTIYEVTGISDVIRGSSDPNETATAQRIKGQFGSLRVTTRQTRVQKFIRDAYRLKAEIIAEHFTREKLSEMTGIDMPLQMEIDQAKQQLAAIEQQKQIAAQAQQQPPQPGQPPQQAPAMPQLPPELIEEFEMTAKAVSWEDISSILRSDKRRGYMVDIETDDTARMDEDAEKERRIEFMNTMQPVIQNALLLSQQSPELVPLAKETVLFTLKGFKVGRQLEETFEDAFDQLASRQKPSEQPNPEVEKLKIESEKAKADIQIKQQTASADMEGKKLDHQLKQADLQLKEADLRGKQAEMAMKSQQMDLALIQGQMDVEQKAVSQEREAEKHELTIEGAKQSQQQKSEAAAMKSQGNIPAQRQMPASGQFQAPQSQLQQVLTQLAMGFDELRKSNEMLTRAVTAPKTTKLIRDGQGRSVGAVQQVLGFEQPAGMA